MLQGYVGVPLDSCQMSLQHAMADSCTAESRPHKASRLPTMSLTADLGFLFWEREMVDGTVSKNTGKLYKCCHFGMHHSRFSDLALATSIWGIQWSHRPTGNEDATKRHHKHIANGTNCAGTNSAAACRCSSSTLATLLHWDCQSLVPLKIFGHVFQTNFQMLRFM